MARCAAGEGPYRDYQFSGHNKRGKADDIHREFREGHDQALHHSPDIDSPDIDRTDLRGPDVHRGGPPGQGDRGGGPP